MKRKPLSDYLELIKSANKKQNWIKAKRYSEIALKKLDALSYSPFEEYLLYCRLGTAYFYLSEFSRSLDIFNKAYLIAFKCRFNPEYIAYTSFEMGNTFLATRNINQALEQSQKVDQYYQKYGNNTFPMNKRIYAFNLVVLGYCYLYKNDFRSLQEIIDKKLVLYQSEFPDDTIILQNYYHLKGHQLIAVKEYNRARQSFEESIKLSEQLNLNYSAIESKIHLATIDLLDEKLDASIQMLQRIMKDASRLKLNKLFCEAGLLLSKCYSLRKMPVKSAAVESRIKSLINKVDIAWLYEKSREFEQVYRQIQGIYQNSSYTKSITETLSHTINQQTSVYGGITIIGKSEPMIEIHKLIEKIAPTDLPVLIQGETGTGKEVIARAIHRNSLRREYSRLAINCGAIPETLLENELFGHAKGAFTDANEDKKGYIELASEGTLFLDEISEMSSAMQQKLLRVLEEKLVWRVGAQKPIPVNTRFLFASNQDIEELVKQKRFRLDLCHRINTIVITLPPLRDRKDDIPLLVKHFLDKYASPSPSIPPRREEGMERGIKISPEVFGLFINYPWPGNVRELENEIKRICTLYPNVKMITGEMLSESIRNYKTSLIPSSTSLKELRKLAGRKVEKAIIIEGLKKYNGNITQTSFSLGWTRRHLQRKIRQLKIKTSTDFITKR